MKLKFILHRLPQNQDRCEFAPALVRVDDYQKQAFIVPDERKVILHESFIGKGSTPPKSELEPVSLELTIDNTLQRLDAWVAQITYSFGQEDDDVWSPSLTHEVYFCTEYIRRFQLPFLNRQLPARRDVAWYLNGGIIGWQWFRDHDILVQPWRKTAKRVQVFVGDCIPTGRKRKAR